MHDGRRTLEQSNSSDNIKGASAGKSDVDEGVESAEEGNQHSEAARNISTNTNTTIEEPKSANTSSPSAAPGLQEPATNKTMEPMDESQEFEKVLYIPLSNLTF